MKILQIEDNPGDARLVREMLKEAQVDFTLRHAGTLESGLRSLSGHDVDVVLLDLGLPESRGLETLSAFQAQAAHLPVVVMTSVDDEEQAVQAVRQGADDYLVKGQIDGRLLRRAMLYAIERKRCETERKRAEVLKDEFIGMVSHEIKTPLTVIIGSLYTVLSEGLTREDRRQLVENALSGAEELAGIVENLLELSRSRANQLVLKKEQADMGEVASEVVRKLSGKSAIHHLVMDMQRQLPPVEVDRVRVERLLNNLIDNAIKYSPEGGEVRISARIENDNLVVGVKDQGPGISKVNQAKLFGRFQRLGKSGVTGIPGIGLGLHVCRLLVEAHGGRIWVESEPGCGTAFCFTVPVAKASSRQGNKSE